MNKYVQKRRCAQQENEQHQNGHQSSRNCAPFSEGEAGRVNSANNWSVTVKRYLYSPTKERTSQHQDHWILHTHMHTHVPPLISFHNKHKSQVTETHRILGKHYMRSINEHERPMQGHQAKYQHGRNRRVGMWGNEVTPGQRYVEHAS